MFCSCSLALLLLVGIFAESDLFLPQYYLGEYRYGVLQSNGKCDLNIKEKVWKGPDSYRIPFGVLLSTRLYKHTIMAFNFLLEIQNILDGCLKPIKILMRLICNSYKEKLQHSGERNEQNLNLKLNKNITTQFSTNSSLH